MNAEAIVSVSAAVVTLTQLIKWAGLPSKYGPITVLVLAFIGISFWGWSTVGFPPAQKDVFGYFAAWVAVATSAAGVYGFTRAAGENLATFK